MKFEHVVHVRNFPHQAVDGPAEYGEFRNVRVHAAVAFDEIGLSRKLVIQLAHENSTVA